MTSVLAHPGRPGRSAADLLALETKGLHKRFGSQKVLAGVDLQVPEGALSAIMGPSGTGKSVLLKHIVGLIKPDAGKVILRGQSVDDMSRSEILALRRDVGVMFQDGALFSSMTLYENVAFPLRQHTDLQDHEVQEVVEEHLEAVGLLGSAERFPNQLSGGMRKRAGLARALVLDPGIVLCDEPDSGLDPVRTAILGELLVDRHSVLGGTMIVVTHNIKLAKLVADHVSLLWRGRVVAAGPAEQIFTSDDPFVEQFFAGDAAGPLGMDQ